MKNPALGCWNFCDEDCTLPFSDGIAIFSVGSAARCVLMLSKGCCPAPWYVDAEPLELLGESRGNSSSSMGL